MMIEVKDTIISDEIFEECFVCDLCRCKGICCVEGDSGAPITIEEVDKIKEILPEIWDDLLPKSKELITKQGIAYEDYDGELVTSIVNGEECVFVYYDEDGICKCAIDNAFKEGRIDVQKPISCHLYPVRLKEYEKFTAVNYNRWKVCEPAVEQGNKLKVPLYKFLKEPLIRRFGEEWWNDVDNVWKQIFNK
jgi:hypothetical protein